MAWTIIRKLPVFIVTSILIAGPMAITTPALFAQVFAPAAAYDSGGDDASSVAVADVNGDGKQDVIVANACGSNSNCKYYLFGFDGTVSVLLGNGDGTFQPAVAYSSGGETPVSVAVADVNGDTKPDIIVLNKCASGTNCHSGSGSVGILLGNGDGTFQAATTYNSGGFLAVSLAVADLNGDGKPDLAVAHSDGADEICCTSPALGVLMGNGDGTFQPAVMYGGGGQTSVAAGDVNGDHRPDLVVSRPPSNLANSGAEILLGNGDGTFQSPVIYDTGSPLPHSVAIADLNGDGKLDLAVDHGVINGGPDSLVGISLGNGDGTFRGAVTYDSAVHAAISVTVSDVDGDGRPDLLLAGDNGLGVLLANGTGTFRLAVAYGGGGSLATSVVAADVNGDGKPDLVTGNVYGSSSPHGALGVLLNNTSFDRTPPLITVFATPNQLRPQNGRMVGVTVFGRITDAGSGVNPGSARFAVKDEYGTVQPAGPVRLGAGGEYSFIVRLQATRKGSDFDGRQYAIKVSAKDNTGNEGRGSTVVTVAHDERR